MTKKKDLSRMSREQREEHYIDRFVTAVESIATAHQRQADAAEEGIKLSRRHVETQEQMTGTSEALEKRLIASMTPDNASVSEKKVAKGAKR